MEDLEHVVREFLMSLPCRDHTPFPPTEVSGKNKDYAQILLDAFADGAAAEMTAVAQYINHHLTIEEKNVSNLELCISLVEMQHLDTVGTLIEKLGGKPRYWRTNHGYWQGSEVSYGETTEQKLRLDILSEESAIAAYHTLIEEIKDPKVRTVLERIIRDEQVHLKLFMEALAGQTMKL